MSALLLLLCLLLAGCNSDGNHVDSKTSEEPESLPALPPIVLERPQPSLVDVILQAANSHAQVSFVTNSEGVECTLTSPDREDRRRLQAVVTQMFGSCKGTVDPPTVSFRLQPMPTTPPTVVAQVHAVGGNDNVNERLQQRWQYEKSRDAREIYDLQAEINSDESALLTIRNSAVAYGQSEILRAKKLRLADLKADYLNKYKESP